MYGLPVSGSMHGRPVFGLNFIRRTIGWPDRQKFAFIRTHDVESAWGLERVKQLAEFEISMGFRS
jgi:hypothetical protein